MTMTMTDTLDRERVRVWLQSLPPTAEAGLSSTYNQCPLANYLKECYSTEEVLVTDTRYSVGGSWTTMLPDWARDYVERIDRYDGPRADQTSISAGVALALLDPEDAYCP